MFSDSELAWCASSITAIVLASTILIVLFKRSKNSSPNNSQMFFSKCENPSCVRCTLYREILTSAKTRLKRLQKLHPNINILRIEQSLIDKKKNHKEIRKYLNKSNSQKSSSEQNPEVFRLLGTKSRSWWFENEYFKDDKSLLETSFEFIFNELKNLFENEKAQWLLNDTPNGRWHVCHLINQGCPIIANCKLCPVTFNVVSSLPSVMKNNVFSNVAFSVIEPGTFITEHYGPTNVRSRCHLGLITPPGCKLTVNGEVRAWNHGKCLIFDDSFLHSVKYSNKDKGITEDNGIRAVLMVDLWNPDVTPDEKEAIDFIFAPKRN